MELAHIDKPSAMLGAFSNEAAARSFHEKLATWTEGREVDEKRYRMISWI